MIMPVSMFGTLCEQYRQFPLDELLRLRDMRLKRIDTIKETHVTLANSGALVLTEVGKSELRYVKAHLAAISAVIAELQKQE
jgi:hypothetical protein